MPAMRRFQRLCCNKHLHAKDEPDADPRHGSKVGVSTSAVGTIDDVEDYDASSSLGDATTTRTTTSTSTSLATTLRLTQEEEEERGARKVQFSTVSWREYKIEVGDSPAVRRGVPLTIGWDYVCVESFQVSVDSYELERKKNHRGGNHKHDTNLLRIPSLERMRRLRDQGIPMSEIIKAIYWADKARQRRQRSSRESNAYIQAQLILERVRHKLWNVTLGMERKRRERLLLKPYIRSEPLKMDSSNWTQPTLLGDRTRFFPKLCLKQHQ